jgi:hypothetical protein
MNKSAWWAWAIKNSICTICWVVLAIVFNKWWIALFSLLFLSSLQSSPQTKKYYRFCDKCGKHSEYADSYNEALDKAKKAGWIHYVEGNKDYCPECKNKLAKISYISKEK